MSYSIIPTLEFKRVFKHLSKKYKSLKTDIQELANELRADPNKGTSLGNGVFKVRMKITSKNKSKSGGARVITYIVTEENEIYLVYIFDKKELENITKKQIEEILKRAGLN